MVNTQVKKTRLPRHERLKQVLATAKELFSQKGFQFASMDELAKRTGVSKPVIYDLFGSKQDLFKTLMDFELNELATRITTAVEKETDIQSRLSAGLKAFFSFVQENKNSWQAFIGATDYPLTQAVRQARQRQADLVAELIEQSYSFPNHKIISDTIKAVAWAINGAVESLANWWLDSQLFNLDELVELTLGIITPNLESLTKIVLKHIKEEDAKKNL
jgi:AcrR family transcriptional regulator